MPVMPAISKEAVIAVWGLRYRLLVTRPVAPLKGPRPSAAWGPDQFSRHAMYTTEGV